MGSAGLGALVGVLYLAARTSTQGLEQLTSRCGFALAAGLVLLRFAPDLYTAAVILFFVGGALIMQWAATNTLVQHVADEAMLGRAISILAVTYFAGAPVGALLLGTLASWLGPGPAFAIAGTACALGQGGARFAQVRSRRR
jgi:hypothetical protein